jgi:hypothetical protein
MNRKYLLRWSLHAAEEGIRLSAQDNDDDDDEEEEEDG